MAARRQPDPPLLEWAAAGLGLLVVLAALGVLTWHAFSGAGAPPDLEISAAGSGRSGDAWRLQVEVRNTGERTAAQVEIEGELAGETASAVIPYVPGHGRREAALVFSERPDEARLRVTGWVEP